MKKSLLLLTLLISFTCILNGYEVVQLVDAPTAGMLQRGEASVGVKVFRNNGMQAGAKVGLFPRFMFGVSYGGEEVVGNKKPAWRERVEFNAKIRLFDESDKGPALVVGFDSQGHGKYDKKLKRYDIKSKGFYAAVSRNFLFLGNLGMHGGINYSTETTDKDKDLNFFFGIDKSIGPMITAICEYDCAMNDNNDRVDRENDQLRGAGKGYLNACVNVALTENLILKVSAYDLLENSPNTIGLDRSIMIIYNMTF